MTDDVVELIEKLKEGKTVEDPIVVPQSSFAKQAITLLRYAVSVVSGYVLGKGWVDGDTLAFIAVLITTVVPGVWGLYETWKNNEEKKTIIRDPSTDVPTDVAIVKGDPK